MNPQNTNQPVQSSTTQPEAAPNPQSPPQTAVPVPPTANNQFAHKAWVKIKLGAAILLASCAMSLLLLPASYNYSDQTTDLSTSSLTTLYAFYALVLILLIVLSIRLFKKAWAFAMLGSLKRRLLSLLPIVISLLLVSQWNRFANLVVLILLLYATVDLKKAGIISSYKQ
ncbi:MAG TPA: hypothetical protein VFZ58_04900 [Candidatus Saccharimonadales bacterium]